MSSFYLKRIPKFIEWVFPSIIWSVTTKDKSLFLTFDDGPFAESTAHILSILNTFQVKATFFLSGFQISQNPKLPGLLLKEGHQLANHGYTHVNGKTHTAEQLMDSIQKTQNLIDSYEPNTNPLFRPPYGSFNLNQLRTIKKSNYRLVMWSLMPGDFDDSISDEKCLKTIIQDTKKGDVIVLHDHPKCVRRLKKILPEYLKYCMLKGYHFRLLK